jgi:hypothetical protein
MQTFFNNKFLFKFCEFNKPHSYFYKLFFLIIAFSCFQNYVQSKEYNVAFYSDFEPISYSANRNAISTGFDEARGYEVDLLKAMEKIPGSTMTFKFHGIKVWNDIWLKPSTDPIIDIAIGGITFEERRTVNADNVPVVATTRSDLIFKQSLLMKEEDANRVKSHADLSCGYVIGAVRGTTGEYRFLAQSDILTNLETGLIMKGITVVLDNKKQITSDGSLSIYNPLLARRTMLVPPNCLLPIVKYFVAEDTMIPALEEGYIDGIARGYIGNHLVAERSNGKFIVTAVYSLECPKQESITCKRSENAVMYTKIDAKELLAKLNRYIEYLTDNGAIGYEEWKKDPEVFLKRAKQYKPESAKSIVKINSLKNEEGPIFPLLNRHNVTHIFS